MDLSDAAASGFNTGIGIASEWKRQALEMELAAQRNAFLDRELQLSEAKFQEEKSALARALAQDDEDRPMRQRAMKAGVEAQEIKNESARDDLAFQKSPAGMSMRGQQAKQAEVATQALSAEVEQRKAQTEALKQEAVLKQTRLSESRSLALSDLVNKSLPQLATASPEKRRAYLEAWKQSGGLGEDAARLLEPFIDLQVTPDTMSQLEQAVVAGMTDGSIPQETALQAYIALDGMKRGKLHLQTTEGTWDGDKYVPGKTEMIGGNALAEIMRRVQLGKKQASGSAPGLSTDEVWSQDAQRDMQIKERVGKIRPERLLEDLRDISNDLSLSPEEKKKLFRYASQGPLVSQWQQHIKRKKNEQGPNRTTAQDRF
jgi:hypothetical protein